MTHIKDELTVAFLVIVMKQNYGKAWYFKGDTTLVVGVNLSTTENSLAFEIPLSYEPQLKGLIELKTPEVTIDRSDRESAELLLDWSSKL